jgi:hypothetical protein
MSGVQFSGASVRLSFLGQSFTYAAIGAISLALVSSTSRADDVTAGPKGINSRGLGLTGASVNIGQVELGRPGEALSNRRCWRRERHVRQSGVVRRLG